MMAMFVHLTFEKRVSRIRRQGICMSRLPIRTSRSRVPAGRGVFAMPVVRDFYVTHQWLRELRRWKPGSIVGVYFRIPDREMVWVGEYGMSHAWITAAEAQARAREITGASRYQTVIPRRIERREIRRVIALPQTVGWRYFPGSNGYPPISCSCGYNQCPLGVGSLRGTYGARRIRDRSKTPGWFDKVSQRNDAANQRDLLRKQRQERSVVAESVTGEDKK
jgi:hypothetical protein